MAATASAQPDRSRSSQSQTTRASRPGSRFPLGRGRRVPVVMQLSAVECGAACLAMILCYHGRETRVSEVRDQMGVGRDGVTAQAIARAARGFGLRVKAYSIEPPALRHLELPAIAHWNFDHYVVVERWSPERVDIVDPAAGRVRLTQEEFSESFTGVVLTFEPGVQFEKRRAAPRLSWWNYLFTYLIHSPGLFAQILLTSLLLQGLGLALPALTKVLVDTVLPLRVTDVMPVLGLGILVIVLANLVTSYLRGALLIFLQARLDSRLMLGFLEHLLALPYRFFEQRTSGDLLMRLASNTVIREALTGQTISIIFDGVLVIGYLAVLFFQEMSLGLFVVLVGLIQFAILIGTHGRVRDLTRRDLHAQAESQSYLVEALTGIATLKASGAEDRALDHWSNLFFTHLNVSLRRSHLITIVESALGALRTFSPLMILWFGAARVLDGTMTLGTLLALNALAAAVLGPLASLVVSGQRLQLVTAHLDRLSDVMEAEPEQPARAVQIAPRLSGRVELRQVAFRYDANAPWVLRDISLTVEPGQKIALVGRSGSGKSTLVKLLLGLYTPTEGEILYDGLPAQRLDFRTLRSQFGIVLQEPFLFSGSIRQNIAFNAPGLPLERVARAAQLAGIHDEIARLPMGYETPLAEGGGGLSGGQRQRISLARALAHEPAILVLDEATSNLDVASEAIIEHNLSQLACTRIVAAHRLSTVRDADLILVLDQGAIVERGTHEELLARGGHYARLVRHQLDAGPSEQPAVSPRLPSVVRTNANPGGPAGPVHPMPAGQAGSGGTTASTVDRAPRAPMQGVLRPVDIMLGADAVVLPHLTPLHIGRDPKCELQVFDPRVSRRHARIEYRSGNFVLTDLDSTNGVYLNGARVYAPAVLSDGDQIGVGDWRSIIFRFETRPA